MTTVISNVHYRTSDGLEDYVFTFAYLPDGWRVYVDRQPGYGSRDSSATTIHRLRDAQGYYVCWEGHLGTLDQAKGVAAMWADATQNYRRNGTFSAPADRSHVQDRSTTARAAWAGQPGDPSLQVGPATRPAPPLAPERRSFRSLFRR